MLPFPKSLLALIATPALLAASTASGQTVSVDPTACLPREANAILRATVQPEVKGSDSVRVYFRRLNRTGAYYWVALNASGGGAYWGLFPKPESREQQELDDEWWELLEDRDWMQVEDRDREWLETWMASREWEAAEYYVAVVSHDGSEIARTETYLAEVQNREDCAVGLTENQYGHAQSLTVGETSPTQREREVFHWLCDGIVTRVSNDDIIRPDEFCRACVVAGWIPVAAAGALVTGLTVDKREPRTVSRTQPR